MIYLENPPVSDPHLNLAIEEYLLRHVVDDEPIFHLYVNAPSVIIGRNQNVFEEIDAGSLGQLDIPVLRRLSGGGTVYHDPGNLNYSLITPDQKLLNNFTEFTRPVIDALQALGLAAEIRNRSSIFVGEKKVSGNAQYATGGRLLSHGTLLLNADLDRLRQAIQPPDQRVQSRAVQSVRSPVANVRDLLGKDGSLDTVRDRLKREFTGSSSAALLQLDEADWEAVRLIADERYHSWAWNIGRSPKFSTNRRTLTAYGDVVLEILVEKGCIQAARPAENDPQIESLLLGVCECLQGVRYDQGDIVAALYRCHVNPLPAGLDEEQLVQLFI